VAGVSHKPRHAVPVDDQRVCACWLYVAEAGLPIVCPSYGDLLKASVVRVGARRARGRRRSTAAAEDSIKLHAWPASVAALFLQRGSSGIRVLWIMDQVMC
jgi:hypothetical protein